MTSHYPRPIRFLEYWRHGDWHVKVYSIAETGSLVAQPFPQIARTLAEQCLSALSSDVHHHCAFVTIHTARMFNQIIVDWWARENELRHLVFKAEPDQPHDFRNITATGEAFCIWELKVIGFERDAWFEHVLRPDTPFLERYLQTVLNIDE